MDCLTLTFMHLTKCTHFYMQNEVLMTLFLLFCHRLSVSEHPSPVISVLPEMLFLLLAFLPIPHKLTFINRPPPHSLEVHLSLNCVLFCCSIVTQNHFRFVYFVSPWEMASVFMLEPPKTKLKAHNQIN